MSADDGRPVEGRIALCVGRFYEDLADALEEGARDALAEAGLTDVDTHNVPGAFELPLAAKYAAESGRYVGIVCLGAVIRGETDHYDYVCAEAARGISQVQLLTGVPVGFGVLTVNTIEQARERVKGGSKRDSGRHAVEAVLASLAIKQQLAERPRRAGFAV
ncbi:MAG TPA: 6,7-dimethyl-8-ribityllumazine synthase [Solirubrobacteraceae bacterium]|jgi:6,7-dimethyl-8-ribityllumazine synthase|nr:6,7-dimethyl-8-ribityllumazine synthase [Solirubrobacteraceae bacterium]